MNYSQYCLGNLQGENFKVSNKRKFGIDKGRFDAILSGIHSRDPEEFTDILTARRFYFFNGSEKDSYRKFIRWILRQEAGNLSPEQIYVFDKLLKKGSYRGLRSEEYSLLRGIIKEYCPEIDCPNCNTDHAATGQYELYPLHYVFGSCFWTESPPHIWQDPLLKPAFEAHEALHTRKDEEEI